MLKDKLIIHLGINTYVVYSLSCFQSYNYAINKTRALSNKSFIPIVDIGVVQLSPTLVLDNVLYVLQFNFNLLSLGVFLAHIVLEFLGQIYYLNVLEPLFG